MKDRDDCRQEAIDKGSHMPTLLFIHHSGLIGGAGVSLRNNLLFLSEAVSASGFMSRRIRRRTWK